MNVRIKMLIVNVDNIYLVEIFYMKIKYCIKFKNVLKKFYNFVIRDKYLLKDFFWMCFDVNVW